MEHHLYSIISNGFIVMHCYWLWFHQKDSQEKIIYSIRKIIHLDISDGHGFYKSWHVKVKIGLDCCTWSFHITFLSSCFIVEKKCTRSATIFQLMAVSLGQSNFRIISWFCQLHAMQSKSISPFSLFFFQ